MNEFELLVLEGTSSGYSFDWDNKLRLSYISVTSDTLDLEITNTGQDRTPPVEHQAKFFLTREQAKQLRDSLTEWLSQT